MNAQIGRQFFVKKNLLFQKPLQCLLNCIHFLENQNLEGGRGGSDPPSNCPPSCSTLDSLMDISDGIIKRFRISQILARRFSVHQGWQITLQSRVTIGIIYIIMYYRIYTQISPVCKLCGFVPLPSASTNSTNVGTYIYGPIQCTQRQGGIIRYLLLITVLFYDTCIRDHLPA